METSGWGTTIGRKTAVGASTPEYLIPFNFGEGTSAAHRTTGKSHDVYMSKAEPSPSRRRRNAL